MSKNIDETFPKELLKKLQDVGLNDKESRVYIALLSRPETGTSSLIRATGLHGQFVYTALDRLEDLGLATHLTRSGRKKFSAASPERILSLVEEKRYAAEEVVQELRARMTGLQGQAFEVFEGGGAFVAQELELLRDMQNGDTIYVLGAGSDRYMSLMGREMEAYEQLRIHKKVAIRLIASANQHNYLKVMIQSRPLFDYRVLKEVPEGVDTRVFPGKLVLQYYGDPVLMSVYKNKEIATNYKGFFEALWSIGSV